MLCLLLILTITLRAAIIVLAYSLPSASMTYIFCCTDSLMLFSTFLVLWHIKGQRLRDIVMTVNNEIISIIVRLNKYPNLFVFIDLHQCNYSTLAELAEEHYVTMH